MASMAAYKKDRILITHPEILAMISRMAGEIRERFLGKEVLLVAVKNGAAVFCNDLQDALASQGVVFSVDSIRVQSYDGAESTQEIKVLQDTKKPIAGKNVILVEDIVDTGLTIEFLLELFMSRGPADLVLAALLSKPARRKAEVQIDFLGTEIEDAFVVGYGLDFEEKYRRCPDIWTGHLEQKQVL